SKAKGNHHTTGNPDTVHPDASLALDDAAQFQEHAAGAVETSHIGRLGLIVSLDRRTLQAGVHTRYERAGREAFIGVVRDRAGDLQRVRRRLPASRSAVPE